MPETLTPPRRPKIFLQGQVLIPDWVEDLDSFRRWRLSENAPDKGEIAFWVSSKVVGKKFQLQKSDPMGHPQFMVAVAD
jgi:hypothetical protein